MSDLAVWNGDRKRKLCAGLIRIPCASGDSPLSSHLATYTSHSSLSPLSVCVCVFVDPEWGLLRGFTAAPSGCVCQRRNLGMCSSNKRERREKKGENGSASAFWARDGLSSMWGDFYTADPENPPVCVCVRALPQLESNTELFYDSEQWEVYWSHTKCREERNLCLRQADRKKRGQRKSGRGDWSEDGPLWSRWSFHNSPAIADTNLWIMSAGN